MKKLNIEEFYATRRYWYHVSTTLNALTYKLKPRSEGFNRSELEPIDKRICVSPTLEQCITALPYFSFSHMFYIYKTRCRLKANPPIDIFDSPVTMEGWIIRPVTFDLVGTLNFEDITDNKGNPLNKIKQEAASVGSLTKSRKLHQWWVKINPWKFVMKI